MSDGPYLDIVGKEAMMECVQLAWSGHATLIFIINLNGFVSFFVWFYTV